MRPRRIFENYRKQYIHWIEEINRLQITMQLFRTN